MTHTPEPLDYREADEEEQYMRGCDFVIEQRDFTDNCKQIVAYCDDEHDASRIVACVNACAGKTNEQLEGAAGKLFTGSAIALWSNYCDLKEKNAALSEQVAGLVGAGLIMTILTVCIHYMIPCARYCLRERARQKPIFEG